MSDPLDTVVKAGKAVKAVSEIISLFSGIKDHFQPFKPEIRVANFDYIDKTWEAKFFLLIKRGWSRRTKRKVEVPAYLGAAVEEVLEGEGLQRVTVNYDRVGQKWIFKAGEFPESEKFLVTFKGSVTSEFLDRWIDVKSSINPTGGRTTDRYWIHAALKDVSLLQQLHDEFSVDRVTSDVRVGVERVFLAATPPSLRRRIKAREELLTAIESGARNIGILRMKYRRAARDSRLKPFEIIKLGNDLTSGDYFRDFLEIDYPFRLGNIFAEGFTELLPERVNVQVHTKVNLKSPAAEGYLTFRKNEYTESIGTKFVETIAEKGKAKKKRKKRKKKD